MLEPREFKINIGDVELAVHEWAGTGDPILLMHATGFHSRCWNQVVKQLPDSHIFAVDLRFHGRSGASGEVDWDVLANDIRILVEQLDLSKLVGVGHSIGGHLIARAAAQMPDRFKHLLLIDPVIMSPEDHAQSQDFYRGMDATDHPVSRRRNQWQDSNEMFIQFRDRAPFSTWQPAVLRDYCDYALRPSTDEAAKQLACDPINEASVYLNQKSSTTIYTELGKIYTPVTLLRAPRGEGSTPDFSLSPTWPELANQLPNCREIYLPDHNHFIPMQDPELVAGYIQQAM
ncbi:MAG: alpha/beta hydrolase [Halioglobus sp.]